MEIGLILELADPEATLARVGGKGARLRAWRPQRRPIPGPLSHSSIVARAYHIPAVLGTGVATERIRSGQRITVDGDAGAVTVSARRRA